jgi:hypothetical protein
MENICAAVIEVEQRIFADDHPRANEQAERFQDSLGPGGSANSRQRSSW